MQSLDAFLRDDLPATNVELETIRTHLSEVLATFPGVCAGGSFPYEIPLSPASAPPSYSFSTNAMILFALKAFTGVYSDREGLKGPPALVTPSLARAHRLLSNTRPSLVDTLEATTASLGARLNVEMEAGLKKTPPYLSASGTFGFDDPFSISWALEIFDTLPENQLVHVKAKLDAALKAPHDYVLDTTDQATSHPLPLLRCLLAYRRLQQVSGTPGPMPHKDVRRWFEERLHLHLSYAMVPDSSFDTAELVFALEGILTCDPAPTIPDALFSRTLDVLAEKQRTNPNLRPYRPLLSTERGMALLPLTIEVFNSLLRIADRLSMLGLPPFALAPILRRYASWLLGQRVTVMHNNQHRHGWHSEHTLAVDRIHTWETSQVLLFLLHYQSLLQYLRRETLLPHFSARSVPLGDVRPDLPHQQPTPGDESVCTEKVLGILWENFIAPRLERRPRDARHSALLFGPPGTGKTALAEWVAAHLGWQLVTVTPGDFVVSGDQLVEAKASAIFRALELLFDVVVLFDEIDRLILDRDSDGYSQQQDIYQFMTPSLLTKLNQLRLRKRCIFLIATNYAERIDRAIKRSGRVDAKLLVLPPDKARRRRQLSVIFGARHVDVSERQWEELLKATVLLNWKPLEDLDTAAKAGGVDGVLELARSMEADIRLDSYETRLDKTGLWKDVPEKEVRALLALSAEVDVKPSPALTAALKKAGITTNVA